MGSSDRVHPYTVADDSQPSVRLNMDQPADYLIEREGVVQCPHCLGKIKGAEDVKDN